MDPNQKPASEEQPDIKKLTIATLVGVIILGAVVYGAYTYSQKKAGSLALPGGTTYLGQSNENPSSNQPPTAPLRYTADASVSWTTFKGKLYPYSFSYPSTLPLVVFPGDSADPVGISWGNITPQLNILLSIENIEKRDPSFINRPKIDFVNNWYKYFSGLKGVSKVDSFTNVNGLKGYKAVYTNTVGATPNLDVFFEVPQNPALLIHLANGIIDPDTFTKIVDSVKWNTIILNSTSGASPKPPQ